MELLDKIYIGKLIDEYGKLLTTKQYDAVSGYFLNDLSLSEIAENEGISRQAAYDLVNKSKLSLLNFEEKVGKLKLMDNVKQTIKSIISEDKINNKKLNKILELLGE